MKILLFVFLLLATTAQAAPPTRQSTYVTQTTIRAADVTSNENAIFNYLQAGVDTYADDSIVNADIASSAAIGYSKLSLANSIVNADVSPSAAIVASKLDLTSPGAIGSTAANSGAFTTIAGTTITATGNVGVGTTSLQAALSVNGNVGIGTTTATGGRLMVQGGNVGIGTVNANQKLTVNGAIYSTATGFIFPDNTTQSTASITLSNVIFSYALSSENTGVVSGTTYTAAASSNYLYWAASGVQNLGYKTVIAGKWVKIAGVSTVTVWARMWSTSTGQANCKVTIGSASGNVNGTASQVTPEWKSFTIDVSGLTNGTTYDVTIALGEVSSNDFTARLGSIVAFGS